jgi:VanZ family protein
MHAGQRPERTRWLAAALAAAAVVAVSLLPADGWATASTLLGVGTDKWLHVAGYAAVAVLLHAADATDSADAADAADATGRPWPVVVAAVALLGFGVELLQWPLATREFSLLDAAANAVGVTFGVAAGRLARAARSRIGRT